MYARQLRQLEQETATVTNLAEQLKYIIKNTRGGGAGVWASNQTLLNNLGGLISEQEGLSYSLSSLAQQFQQLYPGYAVTSTPGAQSPQASVDTTLNTLNGALQSAQSQAQNFATEQTTLGDLEFKNQTAIGNLQAVQVGNEIALAQVQQVQLLRQLVMAMMNSQNTGSAVQLNNQTQSQLGALAISGAPPSGPATGLYQSTASRLHSSHRQHPHEEPERAKPDRPRVRDYRCFRPDLRRLAPLSAACR
jgi:type IV secretion system protein TrbJ